MGQGLVFHWAQLGLQEVAFLPLQRAYSSPGKDSCHLLALGPRWAALRPVHGESLLGGWEEAGGAPSALLWIPGGIHS